MKKKLLFVFLQLALIFIVWEVASFLKSDTFQTSSTKVVFKNDTCEATLDGGYIFAGKTKITFYDTYHTIGIACALNDKREVLVSVPFESLNLGAGSYVVSGLFRQNFSTPDVGYYPGGIKRIVNATLEISEPINNTSVGITGTLKGEINKKAIQKD